MYISVVELFFYGFVELTSLLMLIITVVVSPPQNRRMSLLRSVFMLPGVIAAGVLSSSGVNIQLNTDNINNIIKSLNSTETWQTTQSSTTDIILQDPVWVTFHFLIFIVLVIYIIWQILLLLTKIGQKEID